MAKIKKGKLTIEDALVPVEEQPYEIPENWCWTRLEYYIDYATDYVANGSFASLRENVKTYKDENYALMVKTQDFSNGFSSDLTYTDKHGYEFLAKSELHGGELLLSNIGASIGKVFRVPFMDRKMTLAPNTIMLKTRNNSDVENDFLKYYFLSPIGNHLLNDITTGSATPKFNKTELKKLPLPLPTMQEQKRIVEQIESLFAKLDEAKEKVLEALTSYQNRKTMIIHNAFVGNYTRAWRERNGHSIDDWEHLTLNDVAEYKKGPFGSSITKAMFVPKSSNTYKVYEQGNAIRKTIDYGSYYITEEKYRELKGFAIQAGDIIISCAGTIGEVYKLPEGCEAGVINQALMRVRTFDNIDEKFFIYYFGEVLKGDVNEQANGTAIKNIPPFKIMKAMEIKLPTLAEQRKIVALLDEVLDSEKQSEDTLNMMIEHIDLMKKSILAKAFRGELGTNNPEEESSIALLKEMLEKN